MSRNQLAQYHQSSLNVILAGIPLQPNEQSDNPWEVLKVIDKVAVKGGFTGYNKGDIDVAHRLPAKKGNPSIIIRFKSKSVRMNFYSREPNFVVSQLSLWTDRMVMLVAVRSHFEE